MYQRITFSDFRDAFRNFDRLDNFSYDGSKALFDYLEQLETEYELDVIALCCEFNEESIEEVLKNYDLESLDDLKEQTLIIWEDGKDVLYQVF